MFPSPAHRFLVDGHQFHFRKPSRAGERRIRLQTALALSLQGVSPGLLEALDGDNLYMEAMLVEGLTEAPAHWWETAPMVPQANGTPTRALSFEQVDPDEFAAVCQEVRTFLATFQHPKPAPLSPDREAEPGRVDTPQAVPAPAQLRAY